MTNLTNFEYAIIQLLKDDNNLTSARITDTANKMAGFSNVNPADVVAVVKSIESKLLITMSEGVSLIDQDADHDDEWYKKRDDIDWGYWKDYESQLIANKWSPKVVNTLGDVTDKILGLLKNPPEGTIWDRRGLVIGHVQSGKTANYIGLVSKAADAGYKFIIVIAGLDNNLRKQTQIRIDEGFIGRDSTPNQRKKEIGVGRLSPNRQFPITLTTTDDDFTKQMANTLGAKLDGFKQPVVVVIKKNVNILKSLRNWLREQNLRGNADKIADVPMLMIDDEADNASINTKRDDLDPTRTNQKIRQILRLFRKSCYVGYTATPFANIFINPETSDEMLEDDLFPKDFIYCLDAPTNYFGPQKVFLDEKSSKRILSTINDAEDTIPMLHKKDKVVADLPPSMKQAINDFVIGKAIRILREQENKHCSMMINASRFVDVQRQIKEHVSFYIRTIKDATQFNYALPEDQALKNAHVADLKKTYDDKFASDDHSWSEIQRVLFQSIEPIKTYMINSSSNDTLDYKRREDAGESLTVIAVGGLILSRGLTLEGLIVSYMYRSTKMYDTLMQMGRWFGYRDSFEDVCKIWLPEEIQSWYGHIAEAIEELRQQIKQMQQKKATPTEFGLFVRKHPDAPLLITAKNKMLDAEEMTFDQSLSGRLEETLIVPSDQDINESNLDIVRTMFNKLHTEEHGKFRKTDAAYFCQDVNWGYIEEVLIKFEFHGHLVNKKNVILEYLRLVSEIYPEVDIAFVSLKKPKPNTDFIDMNGWKFYCQTRSVSTLNGAIKEPVGQPGYYIANNRRIRSFGAESVGLSDEQIRKAKASVEEGKSISDFHYRTVRQKPLLMLHLLTIIDKDNKLLRRVPAIGISFPSGNYTKSVKYVANKVQLQQELFDNFDTHEWEEEDDYDT